MFNTPEEIAFGLETMLSPLWPCGSQFALVPKDCDRGIIARRRCGGRPGVADACPAMPFHSLEMHRPRSHPSAPLPTHLSRNQPPRGGLRLDRFVLWRMLGEERFSRQSSENFSLRVLSSGERTILR